MKKIIILLTIFYSINTICCDDLVGIYSCSDGGEIEISYDTTYPDFPILRLNHNYHNMHNLIIVNNEPEPMPDGSITNASNIGFCTGTTKATSQTSGSWENTSNEAYSTLTLELTSPERLEILDEITVVHNNTSYPIWTKYVLDCSRI